MRQILAMIAVLGLTALSGVAAGNDKNLYVVTHVDIAGGGNLLAEATSLIETRQAFDAHLAAAHTKRFREKLQPMLGSPYREGLHRLL